MTEYGTNLDLFRVLAREMFLCRIFVPWKLGNTYPDICLLRRPEICCVFLFCPFSGGQPKLEAVKKTWVLFWLTISAWDFCWAPNFWTPLLWISMYQINGVGPREHVYGLPLLLYSHYVFVHTDVQDICIKPLIFRFSDGLSDRYGDQQRF